MDFGGWLNKKKSENMWELDKYQYLRSEDLFIKINHIFLLELEENSEAGITNVKL